MISEYIERRPSSVRRRTGNVRTGRVVHVGEFLEMLGLIYLTDVKCRNGTQKRLTYSTAVSIMVGRNRAVPMGTHNHPKVAARNSHLRHRGRQHVLDFNSQPLIW